MGFGSDSARGVAASLVASVIFGLLYYYATLLAPLSGVDIFGWRVLSSLPFLTVLMMWTGLWPLVPAIVGMARRDARYFLLLPLSAVLLGVQFWLFLWAPVNGRGLQVSLGYLLMPLVMVICGKVVYKDRLQPFQKFAVALAAFGVANQVYRVGSFSWEVPFVSLGFPVYFMLRRRMRTDNLGGLWFDLLLMIPAAVAAIWLGAPGFGVLVAQPRIVLLILILGIASAVSIGCYMLASRYLSLSLFGLLSYVEPVLLVCVSLLLGERIQAGEYLTYGGVGLAVAVLAFGGMRQMHASARLGNRTDPGPKTS